MSLTAKDKHTLSKKWHGLSKQVGQAIWDYGMIEEGDRLLVAVSGGKDSLVLLKILQWRQQMMPVSFELTVLHVASTHHCGGVDNPAELEKLFTAWGIQHHIVPLDITVEVDPKKAGLSCFWCSWNRRKIFFQWAERLGCTKIALGHHKDDIVETMLMNLFFQSEISSMTPNQEFFNGRFRIIRPLCYVDEPEIARYAQTLGLPQQVCTCPAGTRSNRQLMKDIIKRLHSECPQVKDNIFHSLKRIKKDYLL